MPQNCIKFYNVKISYKPRCHKIHNHSLMADGVCSDNDENLQWLFLSIQKNQVKADALTCGMIQNTGLSTDIKAF